MARRDGDLSVIEDALAFLGPVELRPMFGGHGVFLAGLMFALVADGDLYLKVDGETKGRFTEAGLEPFVYSAKDRTITMSYHRAPDPGGPPERFEPWARLAIEAARRSGTRRPRRTGRGRSGR